MFKFLTYPCDQQCLYGRFCLQSFVLSLVIIFFSVHLATLISHNTVMKRNHLRNVVQILFLPSKQLWCGIWDQGFPAERCTEHHAASVDFLQCILVPSLPLISNTGLSTSCKNRKRDSTDRGTLFPLLHVPVLMLLRPLCAHSSVQSDALCVLTPLLTIINFFSKLHQLFSGIRSDDCRQFISRSSLDQEHSTRPAVLKTQSSSNNKLELVKVAQKP